MDIVPGFVAFENVWTEAEDVPPVGRSFRGMVRSRLVRWVRRIVLAAEWGSLEETRMHGSGKIESLVLGRMVRTALVLLSRGCCPVERERLEGILRRDPVVRLKVFVFFQLYLLRRFD